jgi:hypothetical protein
MATEFAEAEAVAMATEFADAEAVAMATEFAEAEAVAMAGAELAAANAAQESSNSSIAADLLALAPPFLQRSSPAPIVVRP